VEAKHVPVPEGQWQAASAVDWQPMRLAYGVNEADSWWHFALGPTRERIWARLRKLRPRIVRIFLFDKSAPDPVERWDEFHAYVAAVLNVGAVPMVTFAKSPRPIGDHRGRRWFAERCADIVWGCLEQWGTQVADWYWSIWNEPNSTWIGGGVSFEDYRAVYEETASRIVRWLAPVLHGRRPRIGGPAVEGFDPFWLDWVWRFVSEIDPALIGFVNWHRYAEWRDDGERGAPADPAIHRALILAQTADYWQRARAVARIVADSGIVNVCGEWNAHSHYLPVIRARFNQSLFGAVYGASALLHLIRGGVDAEMLWTGTDVDCGYGLVDQDAVTTPLYQVRRLFAEYVRYGDEVCFPFEARRRADIDGVLARRPDGSLSALFVHCADRNAVYDLAEWGLSKFGHAGRLLRLDAATRNDVLVTPAERFLRFDGYGVAVLAGDSDAAF
jgi:hypothetical protein